MQDNPIDKATREKFGQKIADKRHSQGMTRQQLADLTDIDIVTIIQIEQSDVDFPIEYMFMLLQCLGMTPNEFFKDFN